MWTGFPANLSIYSLSAANETESSWATYCPSSYGMDDGGSIVDGTDLGVCKQKLIIFYYKSKQFKLYI